LRSALATERVKVKEQRLLITELGQQAEVIFRLVANNLGGGKPTLVQGRGSRARVQRDQAIDARMYTSESDVERTLVHMEVVAHTGWMGMRIKIRRHGPLSAPWKWEIFDDLKRVTSSHVSYALREDAYSAGEIVLADMGDKPS
jgi:hypothetical protein